MFKKSVIIILLCIFSINNYSQNLDSVYISNFEIRIANLIFNEHEKLSIENPLLKQQVLSLEELNKYYVELDSIKNIEIETYKEKVSSDEKTIKKLQSSKKKTLIGSSIGGILLFIIGLLL